MCGIYRSFLGSQFISFLSVSDASGKRSRRAPVDRFFVMPASGIDDGRAYVKCYEDCRENQRSLHCFFPFLPNGHQSMLK